jgi:O-antigen/teichoic acid export membrane protein
MQTDHSEPKPSGSTAGALGKAAGRGFSWMSLSLGIGKVSIFLAQIVLGWILTDEDFGVLAIVAAVIAFVKIFHDGGISMVLVQRGAAEFERLQGAGFWFAMTVSSLAGIALAAVSPWIAEAYQDERLVKLLCVLALTLPMGTPGNLLRAKLQLDLRFRAISIISAGRFIVRSAGMIVLALLGYGVMSFVIPMLFVAIFECVTTYSATRIQPWRSPIRPKEWGSLLSDSKWVVFATSCRGFARNGDYLILGLLLHKSLLGLYFFGYQLTIQITFLIALNLRHVLFPLMTKLAADPARQSRAIVRTIRMLMLVAAPASILIATIIRPVEELVWRLKWEDAVPLMQIFAVVSPVLILTDVVHAALASRGQFRRSGLLILAEGLWLMGSAWLAVMLAGTNDITAVAMWIFGLQIAYALGIATWVLHSFQIGPGTVVGLLLPQWTVSLIAMGVAQAVGHLLPEGASAIVQIVVLTMVFLTVFIGTALVALRTELQDLANVAPRPIAKAIRRMFFLPQV